MFSQNKFKQGSISVVFSSFNKVLKITGKGKKNFQEKREKIFQEKLRYLNN